MAIIICPNCRSAVSSRERRCWICQKSLAPPVAPRREPVSYPERMRLVRFEETTGGLSDGFRCRIVYVKSIEDEAPMRDYWQAARDQQSRRARRAWASVAAAFSALLFALLWVTAPPAPPSAAVVEMPPRSVSAPVPAPLRASGPPVIRPVDAITPYPPVVFPHQDLHAIGETPPSTPGAE